MELISDVTVDKVEESLGGLTEDVRMILYDKHNLSVPLECTGFIVRCLRMKDYNSEKAATLIKNFMRSIHQLHDMLDKFQPKFYKDIYTGGLFTILNSRDHLGRQVITSRLAKWDPKVFDFDQLMSAAMLIFSYTVGESVETQRKGVVFVNDLSGFGMQHVKAIKPGRLTQLVGLLNDASPGRIKGVHFVFHPKIFGFIYQLVKPFFKEKLSKRIHFHGDDVSSLHKHLSVQTLPMSLGGLLEESAAADQPLIEKLLKADTIHKQLKAYSIPTH